MKIGENDVCSFNNIIILYKKRSVKLCSGIRHFYFPGLNNCGHIVFWSVFSEQLPANINLDCNLNYIRYNVYIWSTCSVGLALLGDTSVDYIVTFTLLACFSRWHTYSLENSC